ncbi:MAG: hypothetical protein ACE5LB_05210, partial [Acidiferrobacterales bacterium]
MQNPLAFLWNKEAAKPRRKRRRRRSRNRRGTEAGPGVKAIEKLVVEEIEVRDVHAGAVAPPRPRTQQPAWVPAVRIGVAWAGLWLLPVLASLFARSPWPVDETRTLAIAWEM